MDGKAGTALRALHDEIAGCRLCETHLPLGPRPVVQFSRSSRIVIVGQAPGTRVHESGAPWDDASGDHLREWLSMNRDQFYDPSLVALVPMGFCYPGRAGSGDAPPRPECAPTWHERILSLLPGDRLLILCGLYAHAGYLGRARKKTLTETVRCFEDYLPAHLPLPHPSWRSRLWMKNNPWFAERVLPELRSRVARLMGSRENHQTT